MNLGFFGQQRMSRFMYRDFGLDLLSLLSLLSQCPMQTLTLTLAGTIHN